jgi:hypothetical protein
VSDRAKRRKAYGLPTKRIRVSVDISIPDDWTIGQTAQWMESLLIGYDAEVNEQRSVKGESK